jgi:hypothetical protein
MICIWEMSSDSSIWKYTFLDKGSWWAYTRMVPYWRGRSHCIPNRVRTFCRSGRHWRWIPPSAECWNKKCSNLSWPGWNNEPMKVIILLDAGWCCYLARYSLISLCCSLISSCYYLTRSCCSLNSCCYFVISCWRSVVAVDHTEYWVIP